MNIKTTNRRRLLTISTQCCLLVVAFAGLVSPSDSAAAAMILSEQSMSSSQVLSAIEGGESQLGGLSVWYDVARADSNVLSSSGARSRVVGSQSSSMASNSDDFPVEWSVFNLLPNLDCCVFASSSYGGSASGFSSSGSQFGHGGLLSAILVPQLRFSIPVLNHFWRGTDFVFVPPVVPDELLRPPQI